VQKIGGANRIETRANSVEIGAMEETTSIMLDPMGVVSERIEGLGTIRENIQTEENKESKDTRRSELEESFKEENLEREEDESEIEEFLMITYARRPNQENPLKTSVSNINEKGLQKVKRS